MAGWTYLHPHPTPSLHGLPSLFLCRLLQHSLVSLGRWGSFCVIASIVEVIPCLVHFGALEVFCVNTIVNCVWLLFRKLLLCQYCACHLNVSVCKVFCEVLRTLCLVRPFTCVVNYCVNSLLGRVLIYPIVWWQEL